MQSGNKLIIIKGNRTKTKAWQVVTESVLALWLRAECIKEMTQNIKQMVRERQHS